MLKSFTTKVVLFLVLAVALLALGCASAGSPSKDTVFADLRTTVTVYNTARDLVEATGRLAKELEQSCEQSPDSASCKTGKKLEDSYTKILQPGTEYAHTGIEAALGAYHIWAFPENSTAEDLSALSKFSDALKVKCEEKPGGAACIAGTKLQELISALGEKPSEDIANKLVAFVISQASTVVSDLLSKVTEARS